MSNFYKILYVGVFEVIGYESGVQIIKLKICVQKLEIQQIFLEFGMYRFWRSLIMN